jgi:conjugal transfer pilus assembly protein TraV
MRQSSGKSIILILGVVLCALCLGGCSAVVSPYNSTFQCPETDKGKCVSVQAAYKESVDNPLIKADPGSAKEPADKPATTMVVKDHKPPCETCGNEGRRPEPIETPDITPSRDAKYTYQDAFYRKLTALIEQPSTPVVVPPDVVRVLILSYTGSENELFTYRYVYFFATNPKWIISTGKEGD